MAGSITSITNGSPTSNQYSNASPKGIQNTARQSASRPGVLTRARVACQASEADSWPSAISATWFCYSVGIKDSAKGRAKGSLQGSATGLGYRVLVRGRG